MGIIISLALIALVVFVLMAGYAGYLVLTAYLGVKAQPREEMFMCPKHGIMRKTSLITFDGHPYCPKCFDERLASVERV